MSTKLRYRHPNGLRCGWCLGGDHRNCVVSVEMGKETKQWTNMGQSYFTTAWKRIIWHCECRQGPHPPTRCLICLRPGVDVDLNSRCTDESDCKAYRAEFGTCIRPSAPVLREDDDDEEDFSDDDGELVWAWNHL